MIDLALIEDAILARLGADVTFASYVPHISPWQGDPEDARDAKAVRLPAALVVYSGGPLAARGGVDFFHDVGFDVLLIAQNHRSRAAAQSSGVEKGTYAMVKDVLRILSGREDLVDGLGELGPVEVRPVVSPPGQSRYLVRFEARAEVGLAEADLQVADAVAVDDLLTAEVTHSVPDGDGSEAIVTDSVEFDQ